MTAGMDFKKQDIISSRWNNFVYRYRCLYLL